MSKRKCSICLAEMIEIRGDYDFPESGFSNIVLKDIPLLSCPKCGNIEPTFQRIKYLMESIIEAVIHKSSPFSDEEKHILDKYKIDYTNKVDTDIKTEIIELWFRNDRWEWKIKITK